MFGAAGRVGQLLPPARERRQRQRACGQIGGVEKAGRGAQLAGQQVVAQLFQAIDRLGQGWITDWGPATERPVSPLYEADGYWRGPIWAPTTMLLWDGLRQQGATELADQVARRFCRLCETSGMAENFDALTGKGLRDRAFAWTSAAYLWLAASLQEVRNAKGGQQ